MIEIKIWQEEICGTWHGTTMIMGTEYSFAGWNLRALLNDIETKIPWSAYPEPLDLYQKFPNATA